ncbi:MAG: hypothetical protein ALECFALPRED_009663 [Alectoria fallacina]|uniref:Uncharacterized protein n=1 Tax=Alectoria fallacina TaxID=1903189 RepID=A0A8H3EXV9_9LECA|nr:MAG: hypothetical protein ALECFALPRED_009663 [Alectoria fallacina]
MNWAQFPPSILALGKGVGIVLSVAFGSINTVKYGVRTYNYFDGPTNTIPAFLQESAVVHFSHESDPCPTCQFVDMDDRLLDYYGRPLDLDQLFTHESNIPHATGSTMPLTVTFAAPFIPNSTGVSTTVSTPYLALPPTSKPETPFAETKDLATGASYSEMILSWLAFVLSWWFFPLQKMTFYAMNAANLGVEMPPLWEIVWLFACRLACATFSRAVTAWFLFSQKIREIQRAKATSLQANAQPATRMNAVQTDMLGKFTGIIHEHHQDPTTMMAAMHGLLLAQYGDSCTLKMKSEEGEARQPKVAKGPSNVQANLSEGQERDARKYESADEPAEKAIDLAEGRNDGRIQQSGAADEGPEQPADLDEERGQTIDSILEDTFQLTDNSEEPVGGGRSRDVEDLLDMERSKWSEEKPNYVAIIEEQAAEIANLQSQLRNPRSLMLGALHDDENDGERVEEEEGPVWPIGFPNYQPPSYRLLNTWNPDTDSTVSGLEDEEPAEDQDSPPVPYTAAFHRMSDEELMDSPEWLRYLASTIEVPGEPADIPAADEVRPYEGEKEGNCDTTDDDSQSHHDVGQSSDVESLDGAKVEGETGTEDVSAQNDDSGGSIRRSSSQERDGISKTQKRKLERQRAKVKKEEEAVEPRQ